MDPPRASPATKSGRRADPKAGHCIAKTLHQLADHKRAEKKKDRPARVYHSVPVPPSQPAPPRQPPQPRPPLPPLALYVTRTGPTAFSDASVTRLCGVMMSAWARPTAYFGSMAGYAQPLRYASVGAMLMAPLLFPFALITDAVLWWQTRASAR